MRSWVVVLAIAVACHHEDRAAVSSGDPALPGIAVADATLTAELAAAVVAKGPAYRPHTRNLTADGHARFTNRLVRETSPYLLQHAHNPMNWFAWGDEPFARAQREHKLVLVSIGYSTCHWCHVMEDDSFEDEAVAAYVNANFICIKVDREERPDVDAVYMSAVVAMTGDGGWPMTLVVDDRRRPVFGGTFLKKDRLLATLAKLHDVAATDPARLVTAAEQVTSALASAGAHAPATGGGMLGADAVERGARALAKSFDPDRGGFGRGMKFPRAPDLELLLRYARRTGDPRALAIVTQTLAAMANGGIHDQIGGGFHRYATDPAWLVPHFEKMLYDNAQLALVYLEASQLARDPSLATIARTTLDAIVRDFATPDGGFVGASDADSPGPNGERAEGRYFTWTAAELEGVLGQDDGALARTYFGIDDPAARVDGRSILHVAGSADPARVAAIAAKLLAARATRPPPARDDKVVASWNGLAISALARGAFALGEPRYLLAAERAAALLLEHLRDGDGLARAWREGRASGVATLTDYASVIAGLLDLFAADADARWLDAAVALAKQLEPRFGDPAGAYFMTDAKRATLIVREIPLDDNAEPSPNAVAALDLLRLAALTDDDAWRTRAERLFGGAAGTLARTGGANALRGALEAYLDDPITIAIVTVDDAAPLVAELRAAYLPNAAVAIVPVDRLAALASKLPFLDGKRALGGRSTAFVCERTTCREPTSDPAVFARQLAKIAPLYPDRSPAPL